MTKVSVIVPVYNVEAYLSKCLDSLVNQTLKDIEIIVVNDGTKDNSQDIIDKYVEKYPKKVKSYIKENGGLSDARNYGLKYVNGKYISFIDSDDWIELDALEKMYNKAIKDKSDIVVCNMNFYYEETGKYIEFKSKIFSGDLKKTLMVSSSNACNKLFKKELFDNNIRFLKNHLYEDLATSPILFLYANKTSYIDKPFYNYLQRTGSIMNPNEISPKLDDIFYVLNYITKEFKDRGFWDKYKDELEYLNIEHLLFSGGQRFLNYNKKLVNNKIKNNIINKLKVNYPNWKQNKYYLQRSIKYKIMCNLIFYKQFWIVRLMKKVGVI